MRNETDQTVTDSQLISFNRLGLIPGPEEKEKEFVDRAEYCLHLSQNLSRMMEEEIHFENEIPKKKTFLQEAYRITKPQYDIEPDWIPFFFSNAKLSPWHGGCAWIFQEKQDSPTAAVFQLRKRWYDASTYLGLYQRKELIAHELSHVGRMMFQEPRFEEMLAYQSSLSSFRRWFGPIVQSSTEALLFVLSLGVVTALDFFAYGYGVYSLYATLFFLKCVPLGLLAYGAIRLWKKHAVFSTCFKNLKSILQNEHKVHAVMYRLTDQEITLFSQSSNEQISTYVRNNVSKTLRWRLIHVAYFASCI